MNAAPESIIDIFRFILIKYFQVIISKLLFPKISFYYLPIFSSISCIILSFSPEFSCVNRWFSFFKVS